ncbi:MAG: hypothetical protein ACXWUG_12640 [Polyangiales bacterium]
MTRLVRRLTVLAFLSIPASCGGAQAHPEYDVLKPPDERTAVTWISRAFRKEGYEVESGRKVKISSSLTLTVDVSAVDGRWSVLWLRADEQQELKGKLPTAPKGVAEGALWALTGVGDDSDERVLVLLEQNYEYDRDPRGEKGVVRSIQEVEARCVRDVTDFLVRAKAGEIE